MKGASELGNTPSRGRTGSPTPSTPYGRSPDIDRVTGEPIRRYEHTAPGEMLHVDVTKFGNIPDGGGHRYLGRVAGDDW
mgnify:CR=1 FL=1